MRNELKGNPGFIPLTARELMTLHGLTVEEGLKRGFCIEGHQKEYRRAHKAALEKERHALSHAGYDHRKKYTRNQDKPNTTINADKEEFYIMDKNTRILLLIHLMSSGTFADMPQTEKAILLTELLYGEKPCRVPEENPTDKPKRGGRARKAAAPAEQTEGEDECK